MSRSSSSPFSSSTQRRRTLVALQCTSSLLMIVYAPDRRWICRASTSSSGSMPSTRKSLNGSAHDGAATITITVTVSGSSCASTATGSSEGEEPTASGMVSSVPELTIAAPGLQSAAPGAAECSFAFCFFASSSAIFRSAGIKIVSDSGEGLMDGLWMFSSDTHGGISFLVDPSLTVHLLLHFQHGEYGGI